MTLLFGVCIIFILRKVASWHFEKTMDRWSYINTQAGATGGEIAECLIQRNNIQATRVHITEGVKTGAYSRYGKTILLSKDIYDGRTVAAIAIAAHEVGHSECDRDNGMIMYARYCLIPFGIILSKAVPILLVMYFFISWIIYFLVAAVLAIMCLQLMSVWVEHDASRRAMKMLKNARKYNASEIRAIKKTLNAAWMTYLVNVFNFKIG